MYRTLVYFYIQILSLIAQVLPLLEHRRFRLVEQMRFFVQDGLQRQEEGVHVDRALALDPFALPRSVFKIQASFRRSCSFILRDGFLVCFHRR